MELLNNENSFDYIANDCKFVRDCWALSNWYVISSSIECWQFQKYGDTTVEYEMKKLKYNVITKWRQKLI